MKQYDGSMSVHEIVIGRIRIEKRRVTKESGAPSPKTKNTEVSRYQKARKKTIEQLRQTGAAAAKEIGRSEALLWEGYALILEGDFYTQSIPERMLAEEMTAERAVTEAAEELAVRFQKLDDAYIRERSWDIQDITRQLLEQLSDQKECGKRVAYHTGDTPMILAGKAWTADEVMRIDKTKVLAVWMEQGSWYSHAAILVRARGIPLFIGGRICEEWNDRVAVFDGKEGRVILDPEEAVLEQYRLQRETDETEKKELEAWKGRPDRTLDGFSLRICANINTISELDRAIELDASGIGLFRSECLFLEKGRMLTEEEQFLLYRTIMKKMEGKRVVIRTLDMGSDKAISCFPLEKEENPALGDRGIRFCLEEQMIFQTQLRALYRASVYGTLGILFPMIVSVEEVEIVKKICEQVKRELEEQQLPFSEVQLGIMIETPAAVMISDRLAKEVDFFSIGTNDLTQYTLAADRRNKKVARIYDTHHPAILRMIRMTVENARRAGCPVGICGEAGGDLSLTKFFVSLGIDELSVSPHMVLPIRKKLSRLRRYETAENAADS